MVDTLAPRAIIGVMTPAMNTVVQPELEKLRPQGVTNQMQRFRLGGEQISDDLIDEAEKLMDCKPAAIAIGLTTDAALGGVEKLQNRCQQLDRQLGIPVCNASICTQLALHKIGAKRIAVATPFSAEIDQHVKANLESAGFEIVAIAGTQAPSLEAICETPLDQIRDLIAQLANTDCDAIAQIGTALPIIEIIDGLERELDKTVIACNAALYWQALRMAGVNDSLQGFGRLFSDY